MPYKMLFGEVELAVLYALLDNQTSYGYDDWEPNEKKALVNLQIKIGKKIDDIE